MTNVPNGSWLPGDAAVAGGGGHFSTHAFPAVADHPLLDGLCREDLCLWRPDTYACRESFAKPSGRLCRTILEAGGPAGIRWAPLLELRVGKGRFILNQMQVAGRLWVEPAAGRLLKNMIHAALRPVDDEFGPLCLYAAKDSPLESFVKQQRFARADKPTGGISLIDGSLPAEQITKAIAEAKQPGNTIILHGFTPETAKIAGDALGTPLVLSELKTGRVIRTGRHPIIDGLSNDDFFWMTGQFGVIWAGCELKPTADLCEFVLDADKSPGWTALTDPPGLAVRKKDGLRIVLDQVRWDKGQAEEQLKSVRIGCSLLTNLGAAAEDDSIASPATFTFIDLRRVVNRGFADEVEGDGKGGWTDQGPKWDLRFFPVNRTGVDRAGMPCPPEEFPAVSALGGCEFALIDPEKNDGKSCLVLAEGQDCPPIAVGKKARAVWLFHAADTGWSGAPMPVAQATITFEDNSTASQQFDNTVHLTDWREATPITDGYVGWHGYCQRHDPVTLYVFRWVNPHPDKKIDHLTVSAKGSAKYMLLAVTLEE